MRMEDWQASEASCSVILLKPSFLVLVLFHYEILACDLEQALLTASTTGPAQAGEMQMEQPGLLPHLLVLI